MNNRLAVWGLALFLASLKFSHPIYANEEGDTRHSKFAVGVNYPGVGVRYFLTNRWALEAKGQFADGTSVVGLRAYRYFNSDTKIHYFMGLEGDLATYKKDNMEGSGLASEIFAGGEYFISKRFSLQLDFGPAIIALKEKNSSTAQSGFEYVVNSGINFYFGKVGQ